MARFRYEHRRLTAYIDGLPDAADRVVRRTADLAVTSIKQRAPVRTGALRDSVTATVTGPGRAVIEEGVPYGIFQEFGTRFMGAQPHFVPGMEDARAALPGIAREELHA